MLDICYTVVDEGQLDGAEHLWKAIRKNTSSNISSNSEKLQPWNLYKNSDLDDIEIADDDEDETDESDNENENKNESDGDNLDEVEGEEDDDDMTSCGSGKKAKGRKKADGTFYAENNMIRNKKYKNKKALWTSDDFGGFNVRYNIYIYIYI